MNNCFLIFLLLIGFNLSAFAQDCNDITTQVTTTIPSDCGASDGQLEIDATYNMMLTLEYSIDGGNIYQASNIFAGLAGGIYSIFVRYTDLSCTEYVGDYFLDAYNDPVIQSVTPTDATNCLEDGSIVIVATGDVSLEYSVDGINWQNNGTFNNLTGGDYFPQVRYDNTIPLSCVVEAAPLTLSGQVPISITKIIPYHPSNAGTTNGSITIHAEGGNNLVYSINGGLNWFPTNEFTGLANGNYEVRVRYSNGNCLVSAGTVVLDYQLRCNGITFTSQAQVDAFPANNPDCSIIDGNVYLRNGSNIQNVDSLYKITHIEGYLRIESNFNLTSIEGLQNLQSVGDYCLIYNCDALTSLEGLQNLQSIGSHLTISYNNVLTSLDGLRHLQSIGSHLILNHNNVITSLDGLQNLQSIGGELNIRYNPQLSYCAIDPICNYLENPNGNVFVNDNGNTCNPTSSNDGGADIQNSCECFPNGITFYSQTEVDNFPTQYSTCDTLGNVIIRSTNVIDPILNLDSLYQITHIEGYLDVSSNAALHSLEGLQNLQSIGTAFVISNNAALTSLDGLHNLQSIGTSFIASNNAALTSLDGFQNLQSIGNFLSVGNNDALTSLDGLQNLQSIGNYLRLEYNDALTSLDGLQNLQSIGTYLYILTNPALTSLDGLQNLQSIGTYLYIFNNPALTSLDGLQNLQSIGGNLTINNNPMLSYCAIDAICNYSGLGISPNSSIYIINNGNTCNPSSTDDDGADIQNACDCFPNGITFSSQTEIDNFPARYSACDTLGNVIIKSTNALDPILNLDSLYKITHIEGYLSIRENAALSSFEGLNNLQVINDYLLIYNNGSLSSLDGLQNLLSIGNYLAINVNSSLSSLDALNSLQSIGAFLEIQYNNTLTSLEGLNNLQSIGSHLAIKNNPQLSYCAIDPICNYLENPIGLVTIYSNDNTCNPSSTDDDGADIQNACDCFPNGITFTSQTDVNNFAKDHSACDTIMGNLVIWDESPLDPILNIDSLYTIVHVNGIVLINSNDQLNSLDGLQNLQSIGNGISISSNDALNSLSGLHNLQTIGFFLELFNNDALSSLDPLQNLQSISGGLSIYDNDLLSYCAIDPICAYLDNPNGTINIYENGNNCNPNSTNDNGVNIQNGCDCFPNDLNLRSQTEIDNFSMYYEDCDTIWGNVFVADNDPLDPIVNADSLHKIVHIEGYLYFYDNPDLHSLEGLHNLQSIGSELAFQFNHTLTSLDGLNSLQTISSSFSILDNAGLSSLEGLNNLRSIGGNLSLSDNAALASLSGLNNLQSIGNHLSINGNPQLSYCTIDPICTYLDNPNGAITIKDNGNTCNPSSTDDDGADIQNACDCFPNGITFYSQSEVDNFPMYYGGCDTLKGNVYVADTSVLDPIVNMDSLYNLTRINGTLSIYSNPGLSTVDGLNNLQSIGASLSFEFNTTLSAVDGLNNLQSIGGSLSIKYNAGISTVDGLNSLQSIGSNLVLESNPLLSTIDGLANLQSIGTSLIIQNNAALSSIASLNNIQAIGDLLIFYNNASLSSLNGLNNLQSIGNFLTININPSLSSLDALANLQTIGTHLYIGNNPSLSSLNGLNNLQSIGSDLSILNNAQLSYCAIDPICSYLVNPNGMITIHDNGNTCNPTSTDDDGADIQNACDCFPNDLIFYSQTEVDNFPMYYEGCDTLLGSITVSDTSTLDPILNLDSLYKITHIDGSLDLLNNSALTGLAGLQNLEAVGNDLTITNNAILESLNGLENLTSTINWLTISNNPTLYSISALYHISSIGENLTITNNTSLTTCHYQPICAYLINNTADGEGTVNNNAPASACIDRAAVVAACASPIDPAVTCFRDADEDTFGNPNEGMTFFENCGEGYVSDNTDCNDDPNNGGASAYPGNTEVCDDGIDNNCDNNIDEGCSNGTCDDLQIIITTTINNDTTIQAEETITASNIIEGAVIVTYTAGITLTFIDGFHIKENATFNAYINDCAAVSIQAANSSERTSQNPTLASTEEQLILKIQPNPVQHAGKILYYLPKANPTKISILNINGQIVKSWQTRALAKGWHQTTFSSGNLPGGLYLLNIQTEKEQQTKKFSIIK